MAALACLRPLLTRRLDCCGASALWCVRPRASQALPKLATKAEFDEALKEGGVLVVYFTAAWCGPCQAIGPALSALAAEHRDFGVRFVKVDVDENDETAEACGISSMPTFQFYKGAEKKHEFSGASEAKIREAIAAHK